MTINFWKHPCLPTFFLFFLFKPSNAFTWNARLPHATRKVAGLLLHSATDESNVEERLDHIAHQLKLEIFDLDEGVYGYATRSAEYGLEVIHASIPISDQGTLGLELTEMAGDSDGRGLVLISNISGAAATSSDLQVGDALTGVRGGNFQESLTGLNYDLTVAAIAEAKQAAAAAAAAANGAPLSFEANRLVKRAQVSVEIVQGDGGGGQVKKVQALAGENLRRLLQRNNVQVYNRRTKRFDMPFSTGNCGGEGICGTCLVKVESGMDMLSPKDSIETMITKGRPLSWRTSCRAVVGPDNTPGEIRIHTQPQSDFEDEIDPGVRDISRAGP